MISAVSSLGRAEGGAKFLMTMMVWSAGSCWTSWANRASSLEVKSWALREANPSSSEGEPANKGNMSCE